MSRRFFAWWLLKLVEDPGSGTSASSLHQGHLSDLDWLPKHCNDHGLWLRLEVRLFVSNLVATTTAFMTF